MTNHLSMKADVEVRASYLNSKLPRYILALLLFSGSAATGRTKPVPREKLFLILEKAEGRF